MKFNFMNSIMRFRLIRRYCTSISSQTPGGLRVFSGIQPSGTIHLGNYFGAVKPWIEMQKQLDQNKIEEMRISVVDLHSITLPQDPKVLRENIYQMTASLIACGLDPQKSNLFLQSMVPQHVQLAWVLGCMTTMARLSHLPQYKEKMAMVKDGPLGIFVYPVLQAADILIYKANAVPVGEDQLQQIELAKHLAHYFNNRYGYNFPKPEPLIASSLSGRVMSLRNPTKKMSKSDPDPKSRIMLTDNADDITSKIKKCITDSTSAITYNKEERPGVSNLIDLWCLGTGDSVELACQKAEHLDTGKFKLKVADVIVEIVNPIRERIFNLMEDRSYLDKLLKNGAENAKEVADVTWKEVSQLVGFR
ncbi:hypothetical protein CHUAL_012730 [Chamberlinius hualienensis]